MPLDPAAQTSHGGASAAGEDGPAYAAGERVVIRDEEWTVRAVAPAHPGLRLDVSGVSDLVRDQEATFFTAIDGVERLDPAAVRLERDSSTSYLRTRLWLDSVLRRSPAPIAEDRIVAGRRALLDPLDYQLRPAATMLDALRPRILIGDAVGLGKTLEIGIALAELIARGRGERILVVTPRAVLKQFQQELFTRFGIPLVRLDSTGIQRVQRELPAGRNPFAYFKRVIVSIDTLKNPHLYRHYLKDHHWDAVVIDECHNLINRGTQNNQLARVLAEHSDALILASATPHNGSPDSFAELISLLDPTAIADPRHYSSRDIAHLYVRRHRGSAEVTAEIADRWRERAQPRVLSVVPTAAERDVLEELESVWLHPVSGSVPVSGRGSTLFPWTLFKAFLSSPRALASTVANRLRSLEDQASAPAAAERTALERLRELNEAVAAPSKLEALVELLRELGVGEGSRERVVIFSERLDTLAMLEEELPKRLGLAKAQRAKDLAQRPVRTLHAQLSDDVTQEVVESFGQETSPIRVLLASDMASEGLNLHKQCHLLIHYDVPWSFIRLQQRNGRIDRYGQVHVPRIHALALADPELPSEVRVVTSLLTKEHEANRALGDAGVLMDLEETEYNGGLEEKVVMRALMEGRTIEDVSSTPAEAATNWFVAAMMAASVPGASEGAASVGSTTAPAGSVAKAAPAGLPGAGASPGSAASRGPAAPEVLHGTRLFADDDDFLTAVISGTFATAARDELVLDRQDERDLITLATDTAAARSSGLRARLQSLPRELVRGEDSVLARISLTGSAPLAADRLRSAQESQEDAWPDVEYLAASHPVLEWAGDRGLSTIRRGTAPVAVIDAEEPVFLTQATWSNGAGQTVIGDLAAVRLSRGGEVLGADDLLDAVRASGLESASPRVDDAELDLSGLQRLVPVALRAAAERVTSRRAEFEGRFLDRLAADEDRLHQWERRSLALVDESSDTARRRGNRTRIEATARDVGALIQSMSVTGRPHVRLLAVLAPRSTR